MENRSAEPVRFDLGVEWALTMLGGGGNPAAFYRIGDERLSHDSSGERADVAEIASGNTYIGLELTTTVEPPADAWWSPIETISNSEHGFERIYQGSALVCVWPLELAPGERRTVSATCDRDVRRPATGQPKNSPPKASESKPRIRGAEPARLRAARLPFGRPDQMAQTTPA